MIVMAAYITVAFNAGSCRVRVIQRIQSRKESSKSDGDSKPIAFLFEYNGSFIFELLYTSLDGRLSNKERIDSAYKIGKLMIPDAITGNLNGSEGRKPVVRTIISTDGPESCRNRISVGALPNNRLYRANNSLVEELVCKI